MRMHVHTNTHMRTLTHVYAYMHMWVHIHAYTLRNIDIHACTCTHAYILYFVLIFQTHREITVNSNILFFHGFTLLKKIHHRVCFSNAYLENK